MAFGSVQLISGSSPLFFMEKHWALGVTAQWGPYRSRANFFTDLNTSVVGIGIFSIIYYLRFSINYLYVFTLFHLRCLAFFFVRKKTLITRGPEIVEQFVWYRKVDAALRVCKCEMRVAACCGILLVVFTVTDAWSDDRMTKTIFSESLSELDDSIQLQFWFTRMFDSPCVPHFVERGH